MKKTTICFVLLLLPLTIAMSVFAGPSPDIDLRVTRDQEPPPSGTVDIGLRPSSVGAPLDKMFVMEILVDARSQEVDGVQVYLDFDPSYLTVVDANGDPTSSIIDGTALQPIFNSVDNDSGRIGYASGHLAPGASVRIPFVLATIRFRAEQLTARTDVIFQRDTTKVNIGTTPVPINAITDGDVRIYIYRLYMPLVLMAP